MEKVIIKTATKKDWNGKTFIKIQTEDGRTGSSSDLIFLEKIGQEIECDVKDSGKEYNNVKQYYFNVQKAKQVGGMAFPAKDWSYEKRKASLDFATRHDNLGYDVLATAERYFEYLNKK